MAYWFVDLESLPMASWQEAFPEAIIIGRNQLDLMAPCGGGVFWFRVRAGEDLKRVLPSLSLSAGQQLVVLADEPNDALIEASLALGAAGCCNTYAAPEVLRQVALVVENGGLWVGRSLLGALAGSVSRILGRSGQGATDELWSEKLSEREIQVARLVAAGASNKEAAERLFITERTVKAHLTAIFDKLEIRDRLQLSLKINGMNL